MADKEAHARDQRQYKLMIERLRQFENDEIGLQRLISDLSGLMGALSNDVDQEWFDAFESRWGKLEETYAGALHRGYKTLPEDDRKIVWAAVDTITEMVKARIEPAKDDGDIQ